MNRPHHVDFTGHGGLGGVDHRGALHALGDAVAQGRQGVGGLARLRHGDGQGPGPERRLAVAELRGDLHVHRQIGVLLDHVLADHPGDVGGAARHDLDALQRGPVDAPGHGGDAVQGVDIGGDGALAALRLVMDLLFHEVPVVALLHQGGRRGDHLHRPLHGLAGSVEHLSPLVVDRRVVAVLQIDHLVGEGADRQGVGADEHLALAVAQHQGRAVAGGEDHVTLAEHQHAQGVGSREPPGRGGEGLERRHALDQVLVDQMGHHLGVGLAGEHPALADQLGLQLGEILDDAVVHHRHPAGDVRVGVLLVGRAVGSPAGVADAGPGVQRVLLQHRLQFAQLARRPAALELAVDHRRHPGGVVAAVLQPLQALDQPGHNLGPADDADDAAHGVDSLRP